MCMKRWDDRDYQWKKLTDHWRNVLKENGLKFDNIGDTFESHYTLQNGKKVRSSLDHVYLSNDNLFTNSRKLQNNVSDHSPIMVDIDTVPRTKSDKGKMKFI